MRVMVVDDDPWLADLLKHLVLSKRPGADVDCYKDMQSAYAGWQSHEYHLVLADWNLPDDSGLTLLQLIRRHNRDTPLVMITGRSDRDSVLAARPLGISAYITKPFEIPKVLECLERLLPEDDALLVAEPGQEDLRAFLASRCAADLDLPVLPRVKAQLVQATGSVLPDLRELIEHWQLDPALCAYLIAAANSPIYATGPQRCTGLADALKRLGLRTSLNLATALALRQACQQEHPLLNPLVREHLDASERLAERVVQLARQSGVDPAALQAAALLHRMGELAVLLQIQLWVDRGNRLDEDSVKYALAEYAKPFALALKVRWGLPMALRELIGAVYGLPKIQVRREQALMRLAAAQCGDESDSTIERLTGLAGLG